MNKPPFEINDNIINLVTKIIEKLTRLELAINQKKDLYLRRVSKIKSVNSSCAIEANTLTEEEVTTIINGKAVLAPQNEITEVKNAYNAYDNIHNFNPYSTESFLDAHKLLTTDLIDESGKFRSGDVGVFDGKNVIHMGARPEFVPKLVSDLFTWGESSDLNPLIKSSVIHFELEFIHPFKDGNGRIGRLWQSLILYKYNKIFEYLPIETLVFENQQKYYDALALSEKEASSTVFIEFMLDMILQTIEKFDTSDTYNKIQSKFIDELSNKEKEVLRNLIAFFDKKEFIDSKKAADILNKNEANVRKYFRKFIELNILIPIGETKGRKYRLNDEIIK
jgi:Fic family protein